LSASGVDVSWVPTSAGMTPVASVSRATNVIPAEAGTWFTAQQGCGRVEVAGGRGLRRPLHCPHQRDPGPLGGMAFANSNPHMTGNRVLIAGGGIGGLAAALTPHQIGVPCLVFEAVRDMRPLGVGANLQPNAVRELYDLGITRADLDRAALPTSARSRSV